MRHFVFLAVILGSTPAMAQDLRVDQEVFATCSMRTNQLNNLDAGLQQFQKRGHDYNFQHDILRGRLHRREAEVHRIHNDLRGKPVKTANWKEYDEAFALYETAMEALREWNEKGDLMGAEYKRVNLTVKSLRAEIAAECGGEWEPAIINKFCDDDSGRHAAFCAAFEE